MLYCRALFFLVMFGLLAHAGQAQSQPAPRAAIKDTVNEKLSIHIVLPKSVSIIRDCARILFSSRDSGEKLDALLERRRQRTAKPEVNASLTVPRNKLTKALHLVD